MTDNMNEYCSSAFFGRYSIDLDRGGRIINSDRAFIELTGYSEQQLKSGEITFFKLIPPEDKKDYHSLLSKLNEFGSGTFGHKIVCAGGKPMEVICFGVEFISDEGHSCVELTVIDITGQTSIQKQYSRIQAELTALAESAQCGMVVLKVKDGRLFPVRVSKSCFSVSGLDPQASDEVCKNFFYKSDCADLIEKVISCAETHQPFTQHLRVQGERKWLCMSGQYINRDQDDCDVLCCSLTDITDHVMADILSIQRELCVNMLSENTEETFFDYDVESDKIFTSSAKLKKISNNGLFDNFIKERRIENAIHPDDRSLYFSTWNKALMSAGRGTMDYRTKLYDDKYHWYRMVYASISNRDGIVKNVYGMVICLDRLRAAKNYLAQDRKDIEKMSVSDHVTGLYNRNAFKEASKEILKEQYNDRQCFAIVYSDINDFSYVNENFGYEAGDDMLRSFADIICGCSISLAGCRIYSDYFVALYRASDRDEVISEISRCNKEFSIIQNEKYPHSNFQVSTGVYFLRSENDDITISIDNANLARRSIKGTKEIPCGVYTDRMRKKRSHDQAIASEIWNAITSGAIELFLQPKFDLVSREIIGAEALTRWRNPDGTYKLPYEFIDVLEDVGYITQLDMFIYEQVLKCLARWKKEGKKLIPISVNFSRKHNSSADFVNRVSELADIYGVDKKLIELEITESCFTQDVKNLFSNMRRLREQGFRIDIDDFGTGYSSLSVLIDAPVDIVKVDKVFIDDIENSERSRDYVQHISKLIQSTRKEIIFEGVETEDQAKILAEGGHTMAQGWLFDKAISVEEFDKKYL